MQTQLAPVTIKTIAALTPILNCVRLTTSASPSIGTFPEKIVTVLSPGSSGDSMTKTVARNVRGTSVEVRNLDSREAESIVKRKNVPHIMLGHTRNRR